MSIDREELLKRNTEILGLYEELFKEDKDV